ncbi:hypothetical protein Q1695_000785 [Nippostrongylus brasiliensis]|nr:hypothetical protein Q1695_000785 [Nippostrongylus brasiliensis]
MSRQKTQNTVVVKMTRDEIMEEFFTPLERLRTTPPAPAWCELADARLFMLLIRYKPAGVTRYAALNSIFMYMKHIYEDEEHGIEIFLNDEDFETVRKRKDLPVSEKNLRFEPRYRIRPSIAQIIQRLDKYWDMKAVEYNEGKGRRECGGRGCSSICIVYVIETSLSSGWFARFRRSLKGVR